MRADGAVACRGANSTAVSARRPFSQVSAGWYHTCSMRADAAVACWGQKPDGQRAPAGR